MDVEALTEATRDFVRRYVLPVDDDHDGDIEAAGGERLRLQLQSHARAAGLLTPHGPVDLGGAGLDMSGRAPVFEAAGFSLFGPMAINANAPDEGNIHLLDRVASADQREQYLRPLVAGNCRSAFAMTEPPPGAGSDPNALATAARRADGGWVINGRKRFITGAEGAGFLIVMARTGRVGELQSPGGATMFLVPASTSGICIERHVVTMDRSMLGGHCELTFTNVFVPDDDVLGEIDEGFRYAQARLGPARMTHVMRWTGAAQRAHEAAVGYAVDRDAFGSRLSDLGMAQQMIADNEIDLAATRALTRAACAELDAGGHATHATSIAKTFAAEALNRVADRSVQLCGGLGVSADLPVAKIARELRPFRIYDGPSEVHRWSIARRVVRWHRSRAVPDDAAGTTLSPPGPPGGDRPEAALGPGELAAIAEVLAENGAPPRGPLAASLIAGGRSNLTFRLSDGESQWALRTPPRSGRTPSAHDVAREFRVTSALGASPVPVPVAVALCEDETLIGGPFAISEFVAGRSVQTREDLDSLDEATLTAVVDALVTTLAHLHLVDHAEIGLGTFGRPDGYAARQVRRWSGQWELVGHADLERLARPVMEHLQARIPAQRAVAIVHGDFRIDNTLLDLTPGRTPQVAAVVDWELSTIGDPVADVAMMCAYRHPAFDLIVGAPSAWTSSRLPSVPELAARYASAGGISLEGWDYHLALAYFKIAVIAAGIDHRRRAGSGTGAGFNTAGRSVETYLELARDALDGQVAAGGSQGSFDRTASHQPD